MNTKKFSEAMGEIDNKYIEKAINYQSKSVNHRFIKWGTLAACLCLIIVVTLGFLHPVLFRNDSDKPQLLTYMDQHNFKAELIEEPKLFLGYEKPLNPDMNLIVAIQNATTIQGTITSIECVRVEDINTTCYITAMTIAVDDVLNGNIASKEVHTVCMSKSNVVYDASMVPVGDIAECYEGMNAVFVLSTFDNGNWTIAGTEVNPKELGDYYVSLRLNKDGNTLVYPEQGISINLDELN